LKGEGGRGRKVPKGYKEPFSDQYAIVRSLPNSPSLHDPSIYQTASFQVHPDDQRELDRAGGGVKGRLREMEDRRRKLEGERGEIDREIMGRKMRETIMGVAAGGSTGRPTTTCEFDGRVMSPRTVRNAGRPAVGGGSFRWETTFRTNYEEMYGRR